jgi:PKHD-type hydroxylase
MNSQVTVLPEVFTKEFCEAVCASVPFMERGRVGDKQGNYTYKPERRNSDIFMLEGHLRYPSIYEAVYKIVHEGNLQHFNFDLCDVQVLQYAEYSAEYMGEYKEHKDTSEPDEDGFIRKLSLSIQLSDSSEYEGGNLIFPDIPDYNHEDAKKLGTAIMFPSYMTHQVTPVTSGLRKSLVGWVMGPQFR